MDESIWKNDMVCNITYVTRDGWMTFLRWMSFSTVLQSYQDSGRTIMKDCVNGTPFTIEKILASGGARTHDRYISRPVLNPMSYRGSLSYEGDEHKQY